jgi:hypothetical protein
MYVFTEEHSQYSATVRLCWHPDIDTQRNALKLKN